MVDIIYWNLIINFFSIDDPNVTLKQGTVGAVITDEEDCLDTLLENVEYPDSVFHDVFSDPSSSESSDEFVFNKSLFFSYFMIL
jgi:hypothetical protein